MSVSSEKQHPLKGILFFMTAIFLISVVDTVCKVFTRDLHSIQLVWGYFVGINLSLWVFFLFKKKKTVQTANNWTAIAPNYTPRFFGLFDIKSLYRSHVFANSGGHSDWLCCSVVHNSPSGSYSKREGGYTQVERGRYWFSRCNCNNPSRRWSLAFCFRYAIIGSSVFRTFPNYDQAAGCDWKDTYNSILYGSWGVGLVQHNCAFRLDPTNCRAYPCVLSDWNYGSPGSSMYDHRFR